MPILHLQYEGFPTTQLAELNWLYVACLKEAAPVQLTREKGLDFFKMGIGATVCYIFFTFLTVRSHLERRALICLAKRNPLHAPFGFAQSTGLCNSGRGTLELCTRSL